MPILANYSSASFLTAAGVAVSPNASVEVREDGPGGGALAALFEDEDGTIPLDNPFDADALGRFEFYAAGRVGGYQVTVTKAGGGESHVVNNQAVGNAAQLDAGTFGAEVLASETKEEAQAALDLDPDAADPINHALFGVI